MEKVEYQVNQLEDFLQVPLINFLYWLAPNAFDLSNFDYKLQITQLEIQYDAYLNQQEQIKLVENLLETYKPIYENIYLNLIKPYLQRPLNDFLQELKRLSLLSLKNDFIFADLPPNKRDIILRIVSSKRIERILSGKDLNFIDYLWTFKSLRQLSKISEWTKEQFGAKIPQPHFNRFKLHSLIYSFIIRKNTTIEPLREFISSIFGELILKIAEFDKVQQVYPKLLELVANHRASFPQTATKNESYAITRWKKDKVEFYQLIYALHGAGYIDGEVTKLVEQLAKVFDIELARSWQSALSKNVNVSNNDYKPKIFDELKKAYLDYMTLQLEKKK